MPELGPIAEYHPLEYGDGDLPRWDPPPQTISSHSTPRLPCPIDEQLGDVRNGFVPAARDDRYGVFAKHRSDVRKRAAKILGCFRRDTGGREEDVERKGIWPQPIKYLHVVPKREDDIRPPY